MSNPTNHPDGITEMILDILTDHSAKVAQTEAIFCEDYNQVAKQIAALFAQPAKPEEPANQLAGFTPLSEVDLKQVGNSEWPAENQPERLTAEEIIREVKNAFGEALAIKYPATMSKVLSVMQAYADQEVKAKLASIHSSLITIKNIHNNVQDIKLSITDLINMIEKEA